MARYRVGDRYLSQEEYDAENDSNWGGILFLVGAIFARVTVHGWIASHSWPKWAMFASVIIAGIAFGGLLAFLRKIIGAFVWMMIACIVLYYIGLFIWH